MLRSQSADVEVPNFIRPLVFLSHQETHQYDAARLVNRCFSQWGLIDHIETSFFQNAYFFVSVQHLALASTPPRPLPPLYCTRSLLHDWLEPLFAQAGAPALTSVLTRVRCRVERINGELRRLRVHSVSRDDSK